MKKPLKIWCFILFDSLALGLVFFIMPFDYTSYRERGGVVLPAGEITRENPFIYCQDYDLNRAKEIHLMLATYDRSNTSRYDFDLYEPLPEGRNVITHETFQAQSVADNEYRIFQVHPNRSHGPLCMALSSVDAVEGNAITVWLNAERKPLVKIVSNDVLADAVDKIAAGNMFHLGNALPFMIFFVYVAGVSTMILYLLFF